jgi:hypothetical protein
MCSFNVRTPHRKLHYAQINRKNVMDNCHRFASEPLNIVISARVLWHLEA